MMMRHLLNRQHPVFTFICHSINSDFTNKKFLASLVKAENQGLLLFIVPSVVGEQGNHDRAGAAQALLVRSVIMRLDRINAFDRLFQKILFRPVTVPHISGYPCPLPGVAIPIVRMFTGRL